MKVLACGCLISNKPFDFGVEPDLDQDAEFLKRIFFAG